MGITSKVPPSSSLCVIDVFGYDAVPAQVCLRLLTKITKGNSTKFRSVSCGTIATESEVAIYTAGTVQTELFRLAQASEVAV